MNSHVGYKAAGYEGMDGQNGFGDKNMEGELLLEFADTMELEVTNTCFKKDKATLVT